MLYKVKIGTRKSELALTQTNLVCEALKKINIPSEICHIITTGDRDHRPFQNIVGDGFFTKELERQLLSKKIQLAVHSSKDLPSQTHHDLPWVAFGNREDPLDVLIIPKELIKSKNPLYLQDGLIVGTSSPRREFQLQKAFPNIIIKSIRGNVWTRIEKVLKKEVGGTVLAWAGIHRLGLENKILELGLEIIKLPFVAAPCQGILGVQAEIASSDLVSQIANPDLTTIARAEKTILALLGGGCQLAVGARITKEKNTFHLKFEYFTQNEIFSFDLHNQNISELLRELFLKITHAKQDAPRVILAQNLQHQLQSAQKLVNKGFQVIPWCPQVVLPTWKMSDFEKVASTFSSLDALIFTSRFAVRIFMNDFISLYPDLLEDLKNKKIIYAVGPSTQEELKAYGLLNIKVPHEAHGKSLLKILKAENPLYVGTKDSLLMKLLDLEGRNYKFLELYRSFKSTNSLSDLPQLQSGDRVVLTSPGQAQCFIESLPQKLPPIQVYAFGPSTSKALAQAGIEHELNPQAGQWDMLIEKMK